MHKAAVGTIYIKRSNINKHPFLHTKYSKSVEFGVEGEMGQRPFYSAPSVLNRLTLPEIL